MYLSAALSSICIAQIMEEISDVLIVAAAVLI